MRGMTYSKPRHDIVTHYNATTQVGSPLHTGCHKQDRVRLSGSACWPRHWKPAAHPLTSVGHSLGSGRQGCCFG